MILTDEEISAMWQSLPPGEAGIANQFSRLIEAAVIEKLKAQKPVAYQHRDGMLSCRLPGGGVPGIDWTPLYAYPTSSQPTGKAPCARHCESNAYEIEIRRLKRELELQSEHFADKAASAIAEAVAAEREWCKKTCLSVADEIGKELCNENISKYSAGLLQAKATGAMYCYIAVSMRIHEK